MRENSIKVLVLCTVSTGLDMVAEILRCDYFVSCIVGVNPHSVNEKGNNISGYTDVKIFADKWKIPYAYAKEYELNCKEDINLFNHIEYDIIWVAGWQRLIPNWLISSAKFGALGGHGSPDGINGGRGRSPQNWAILLGAQRFDISIFKIFPGIDDGPIVSTRSFFYNETDDIDISYKKAALCMAEMVKPILKNPAILDNAVAQENLSFYYPQRKPEDGYVDWNLKKKEIWAHCRALTKPYPGLYTYYCDIKVIILSCLPFDDEIRNIPGYIDFVFEDNSFLVCCSDGRILVRTFVTDVSWKPTVGYTLKSQSISKTMRIILERHKKKYSNLTVAKRIALYGE